METYDLTIVGGGPVGLFGASLASLQGLRTQIIESLSQLGGQLTALYPEKQVYDVGGFAAIPAADLAQALVEQMQRYRPSVHLGETAERIERLQSGEYELRTSLGVHRSKAVLVTAGIGAFVPRRLPASGAERFEERGVYYVPPALKHFQGMNVVVVGGGDTAVDWALALASHARHVVLVHRRNEFRAQQDALDALGERENVELRTPCELVEIAGEESIQRCLIKHAQSGAVEEIPADAVVGGLGFHAQLGPLKEWGIKFQGSAIEVDPASMETNLPGVYAAGDVAAYPGKVRLIATGFGEIGIAVASIRRYVNPNLTGALPHSSSLAKAAHPEQGAEG